VLPQPPRAEQCRPTKVLDGAPALLERSLRAMRVPRDSVLQFRSMAGNEQNIQSDRWYPPYFSSLSAGETWFDPRSRVERTTSSGGVFPGSGGVAPAVPGRPAPPSLLTDARATYLVRDTSVAPLQAQYAQALGVRRLNPWAVVGDWAADAAAARVAGECFYRDYWRVVLARGSGAGEERLYLDPKSWFPVKAERDEAHWLWGQRRVETLYSTWFEAGGAYFPGASFELADGATERTRTVGAARLVPRDSAPGLTLPAGAPAMAEELPTFLRPDDPDTVRVAPGIFLLVNRGYTQAVALARDTVWVLDATQAEARARHDSAWIARLFPGRRPVAVVVTDLAWPHLAGVRFWVANGATVVSHRASRDFLQRVVDHRWTREPDALERLRRKSPQAARLRFRAVEDSLSLAGGALRLYAIDGIGSEGALMAYFPAERFLWASDYVQSAQRPALYTTEVWRAARRAGITPERVAAQHLPITTWDVIERLAK